MSSKAPRELLLAHTLHFCTAGCLDSNGKCRSCKCRGIASCGAICGKACGCRTCVSGCSAMSGRCSEEGWGCAWGCYRPLELSAQVCTPFWSFMLTQLNRASAGIEALKERQQHMCPEGQSPCKAFWLIIPKMWKKRLMFAYVDFNLFSRKMSSSPVMANTGWVLHVIVC